MSGEPGARREAHGLSTRAALLAAVGVVFILALALFAGFWLLPFLKTRAVVRECARSGVVVAEAKKRLGGERAMAERLAAYLRFPDWLAPDKHAAWFLLGFCEGLGVPVLVRMLEDPDSETRLGAARLLGGRLTGPRSERRGPRAEEAVRPLIRALADTDARVRAAAATSLRLLGSEAKEAVESLLEAARDGDKSVRKAAAQAVAVIGALPGIPAEPYLACLRLEAWKIMKEASDAPYRALELGYFPPWRKVETAFGYRVLLCGEEEGVSRILMEVPGESGLLCGGVGLHEPCFLDLTGDGRAELILIYSFSDWSEPPDQFLPAPRRIFALGGETGESGEVREITPRPSRRARVEEIRDLDGDGRSELVVNDGALFAEPRVGRRVYAWDEAQGRFADRSTAFRGYYEAQVPPLREKLEKRIAEGDVGSASSLAAAIYFCREPAGRAGEGWREFEATLARLRGVASDEERRGWIDSFEAEVREFRDKMREGGRAEP